MERIRGDSMRVEEKGDKRGGQMRIERQRGEEERSMEERRKKRRGNVREVKIHVWDNREHVE